MAAAMAQLARPVQWALLQAPVCVSQSPCIARRTPSARPPQRRAPICAAGKAQQPDLPPDAPRSAVADWASAQFLEAARSNLTKACLLLALEEEATTQAAYLDAEGLGEGSLIQRAALRRSVGTASTWSLERIASLAEECTVTFYAKLHDLGVADTVLSVAKQVPDSTLLTLHTDLVKSYPTQLIMAINHVLYERHGYRRQRRHGDPRDMRLSNVLENGNGSPGSLAVLYLELAARLSLPLRPVALEGGRYFVLQPADDSITLSAAGERFVIDPYSEGMLLPENEVKELFGVEGELRPCSNEEMLAAMLGVLRDTHWCAAIGCPPEPIWAVPINVEVALGEYRDVEVETSSGEDTDGEYLRVRFTEPDKERQGSRGQQWWPAQGDNLQRALAAAHKRSLLLPGDLNVQLEYALLLYFDKRYEEAWTELGCVLQCTHHIPAHRPALARPPRAAKSEAAERVAVPTFDPEEIAQMEVLWEKIRLQLAFAS